MRFAHSLPVRVIVTLCFIATLFGAVTHAVTRHSRTVVEAGCTAHCADFRDDRSAFF